MLIYRDVGATIGGCARDKQYIDEEIWSRPLEEPRSAASGDDKLRAQNQRSEMLLHTDASAHQLPPDFLGLACVANEGHGGRSVLLDIGDAVALLSADEDTLDSLQKPFPFIHPQHRDKPPVQAPVLTRRDADGFRVRYRKENLSTGLSLAGHDIADDQRHGLDALARCLESGVSTIELRLRPDDYLLFDNTRYLHGRTEIEPGAHRLLKRTYFRRDTAC